MAAAAAAITEKFVGSTAIKKTTGTTTINGSNNGLPNPSTVNPNGNHHGLTCYGYEEVLAGVVEDHQQKVPVWVGPNCKLVSGINKSTTCHDLISSILPSSQDPSKYVIVEKWKKMERILDSSVKILKVWKAWGDQIGDVSFVLRSSPTADGYIDKKTSRKVHRKRSSSYHHQKTCHEDECDKEGHRDAMEQLIKLVITQGEAIQAQLRKLRQQEEQIERYEEKMHKIRSSQMGENYVVDTYLKDEAKPRRVKRREKSPCKKDAHQHHHHYHHHHARQKKDQLVGPEQALECGEVGVLPKTNSLSTNLPSTTPSTSATNLPVDPDNEETLECREPSEIIKEKTELMENIFQLNVRLTQEEERLVKLGLKIRKLSDKQRKAEWEELALQDISQELDNLRQITQDQSQEIEINERDLTALEQLLDDKHDHVAFLTHEIQLIDEQSEILQRKLLELSTVLEVDEHSHHHTQIPDEFQTTDLPNFPNSTIPPPNKDITHQDQFNENFHTQPHIPSTSSLQSYRIPTCPEQKPTSTSSVVRYKSQHQQTAQESCSSSCSNSSSVCVQLNQKQCSGAGAITSSVSDPQDNDSNSDTGISSLHSSVDENPMYVLDTLV